MVRVTGIGGVFFKAQDPAALRAWYRTHLGIDVQVWGGAAFPWVDAAGQPVAGKTAWFVGDGESFAPSTAPFMVNYRVADLDGLLAALRAEGCEVLEKTESSEYGKFGWVMDPEGHKVELWQPPEGLVKLPKVDAAVSFPTMGDARIRRRLCTAADLTAVHALYMHPAVVPYLGHDPMPLAEFRTLVFDGLLASGNFFCVDGDSGALAGFYRVMRHEGRARHVADLGTLAVAPAAHGTGLARAMVEEAIALLQQAGVRRVELMLEADNPRALAFYRKLGFQLEGTMRAAYQRAGEAPVDELFMARLLPPGPAGG